MHILPPRLFACGCLIALAFVAGNAAGYGADTKSGDDPSPDHRLVFLGDRGPHQPSIRAAALIPALKARGIAVDYTEDVNVLASADLSQYDGLILYANIDAITPEQESGLMAFVESGKGFVPLHCASFCFRNSQKFVDLVGAQFQRHGGEVFSTRLTPQSEPVFEGFGGFESWDETYIHHMHNERDRVVLEYRDQGPQADGRTSEPWTWIRRQGQGRVFYTAWGHDLRTWNNPGFQNLVERGIRWACGGDPARVPDFVNPMRFEAPTMVDGGGDLQALQYDDVGPKVPHYMPNTRRDGRADDHHQMQRPLPAEESLKYYATPENFALQLYAAEPDLGPKPIAMTWDERGRLWVCESTDYPNELKRQGAGGDRIRICEDTSGDGRADVFTVFAENLSIPTSIAFHRGGAIVQNGTETLYLKDTDGDDRADVRETLISGWNMNDTHGGVSNFQYGLDNWIWAMQGYNASRPTYVDADGVERQGPSFRMGFFRFRLSQSDPPRVVDLEFLRSTNNNTWGLGISEEGLVFGSTANGNPSVFMSIPNRYYERVRGWAAETLDSIADTYRFAPLIDKVRQVDHFGGYTAGAGHALYTARAYPPQWWNKTAFVCGPTGHLVGTFVLRSDGAGFESTSPCNLVASRDEWSAPIMAEVGPDGYVWILDWYNYIVQHNPTPVGFSTGKGAAYETDLRDKQHGRVYRLTYQGDEGDANSTAPVLDADDAEQLAAALQHPTKLWRLHAQRLLVERGKLDVVPALVSLIQDDRVDSVGLNVGTIHALGALQGLGAFGENASHEAIAALHAALSHSSAGVRRSAIAYLPIDEASCDVLLDSGVLRDVDAQVQLAAVLALADLPPSSKGAETLVDLLNDGAASDRWISDAVASAAAMHGVEFMQELARRYPRASNQESTLPAAGARTSAIVAEHLARGDLDGGRLALLLSALADADKRLAAATLTAFARHWPDDRETQLPPSAQDAIRRLLAQIPIDAKSDLLRLARLWHAGDLKQLNQEHGESLRALAADGDLADAERILAAQAWVRLDPEDGSVGEALLEMITPQTSPPLLSALLRAASESRSEDFGERLIELYSGLLPQGREAVVGLLLENSDSTRALLDAVAANEFDIAELSLDQIATLNGHPVESIRQRAGELIAASGASPDPDRQEVLAKILSVTETIGDAANGAKLFTKHCAVCHTHGGAGSTIGPDLTGMFIHPKQEILGNIIDPSRDVEGNYRRYSVVAGGKIYAGLFASESRTTVALVDSSGERHVIQRDEIDEVFPSAKSLMPDGFENQMSREEIADVLEFLAAPQRYVPLPLTRVATASSMRPLFGGPPNGPDRLVLRDWSPRTVHDVPFALVDPQEGAAKNILLFQSDRTPLTRQMPATVLLPCGYPAKALHLLSGVSGWGFPFETAESPTLIVRLHYEDGKTEDHELKNGVHFADYIRRVDVPESEFAFAMGRQQMRYLAIEPRRKDMIAEIEFIKAGDATVPIVLAVTAELPSEQ